MATCRALVIGHNLGASSVESHPWVAMPEGLNVADYEVVILDFTPATAEDRKQVELDRVPTAKDFANLLTGPGVAVGIGDPTTRVGTNPFRPATWWMPAVPRTEPKAGTTLGDVSDEFSYYFKLVDEWQYHAAKHDVDYIDTKDQYVRYIHPQARKIDPEISEIATTQYGALIAWELHFSIKDSRGHSRGYGSDAYWLPTATRVSAEDAVIQVLSNTFDLITETEPPSWTESISLPVEADLRSRLENLIDDRKELEREIDEVQDRLLDQKEYKKLLYAKGEEELEPPVREALSELGADVEPPSVPGQEDGRLTDPSGRHAILEIKGRRGTLRRSDVRQLEDWRAKAAEDPEWDGKAILIANLKCEQPPGEREDMVPSNSCRLAERYRHAIVSTGQLYAALQAKQAEGFDSKTFWDEIFTTEGVTDLPSVSTGN